MTKRSRIDWGKLADEARANDRPHAGHFSWESNRAVAEQGVLWEFENSLKQQELLFFSNARHRGSNNDPPDCEADDNAGGRVGIEITELVDPASAAAARAGNHYDWKDWGHDLVPALARIIRKKDAASAVKEGPYAQYVLVLHTDEPWLVVDDVRRALAGHVFPTTCLITRAYLLISYDPFEKRYPCIPIRIQDRHD